MRACDVQALMYASRSACVSTPLGRHGCVIPVNTRAFINKCRLVNRFFDKHKKWKIFLGSSFLGLRVFDLRQMG